MREHKYRAWDNLQGGKFEYWDSKTNECDGIFWEMIQHKYFEEPNQYIGLLDKNEIEIYKGDLIEHNKNIFEVKQYESGEFYLEHSENSENIRYYFWIKKLTKYIKVIGNIYEKGKKET